MYKETGAIVGVHFTNRAIWRWWNAKRFTSRNVHRIAAPPNEMSGRIPAGYPW